MLVTPCAMSASGSALHVRRKVAEITSGPQRVPLIHLLPPASETCVGTGHRTANAWDDAGGLYPRPELLTPVLSSPFCKCFAPLRDALPPSYAISGSGIAYRARWQSKVHLPHLCPGGFGLVERGVSANHDRRPGPAGRTTRCKYHALHTTCVAELRGFTWAVRVSSPCACRSACSNGIASLPLTPLQHCLERGAGWWCRVGTL